MKPTQHTENSFVNDERGCGYFPSEPAFQIGDRCLAKSLFSNLTVSGKLIKIEPYCYTIESLPDEHGKRLQYEAAPALVKRLFRGV